MLLTNQITPLGNGQFKTPAGVFNSYAEAVKSVSPQMSPAQAQPSFGSKLEMMADPMAMAKSDASIQSSPAQPMSPEYIMSQKKTQDINKLPPAGAGDPSFLDKLTSKNGIGAISAGMLALSKNPAAQQFGLQQLGRMQEQAQATKRQNRTIEDLRKFGMPEEQISMLANNPDLLKVAVSEMYKSKYGTSTPADQQAFENLIKGFSKEDQEKARRIKAGLDARAGSQFNLSPEELALRQYYTTGGKLTAEQEVENAKLAAGRAAGMRMFEYGLSNLEESLAGTTTGKLAGYLPAITANQQKADQAVAMLAPILKQTFRAAGEGVFTDKDQELLMAMIPTRGSSTAVIQSAIQALNQLVMLKLETGAEVEGLAKRFGIDVKMPEQPTQGSTSGFSIKSVK